jgi:hypothetical protein
VGAFLGACVGACIRTESFIAHTHRQHKQVSQAGSRRGREGGQALCSGGVFGCLCVSMHPHRVLCSPDQEAAQAGEASWQDGGRGV